MEIANLVKAFIYFFGIMSIFAINSMDDFEGLNENGWNENTMMNDISDCDQGIPEIELIRDVELAVNDVNQSEHSCEYSETGQNDTDTHTKLNHPIKYYVCPFCDVEVRRSLENCYYHILDVHARAKRGIGGRSSGPKHEQVQAKKIRFSQDKVEKKYKCDVCSKCFISKGSLSTHKSSYHRDNIYKCEIKGCSQSFKSTMALRRHKKVAHGDGFKCDMCSRYFKSDSGLGAHKRRQHGDGFKCGVCEESFKSRSCLCNHIWDNHSK